MKASHVGLIISGAIVLVIAGIIGFFLFWPASIGAPTEATTTAGALDIITMDADPTQLVNIPTNGTGAEALYNDALKLAVPSGDWRDYPEFMEKVTKSQKPQDDSTYSSIIDKLVEAAAKPFPANDPMVLDQIKMSPMSDATSRNLLYGIGKLGGKIALFTRDADKERAHKIYEAVFIFGYRLWHNGAYVIYHSSGVSVMSEGTAGLHSYFNDIDKPKANLASDIEHACDDAFKKIVDKQRVTAPSTAPIPGDMWNLALHDQDPAWRIEGIMWLGVAKLTSVNGKERAAVQSFLEAQSHTTGDKLYTAAAAQAAALTEDDKNQIPNN